MDMWIYFEAPLHVLEEAAANEEPWLNFIGTYCICLSLWPAIALPRIYPKESVQ